ncbi:glutamine-hydrolyzing GMP synthase [Fervidicoccus fontis]|uniref:GMP synthase (glutamine-hydrolyzing) n=1 Tax=Fervidicoccus fontis TaxID=683846 RepID=A0A843AAT6_9CREN|nr:glutamine-hydrolyzing GMP synthase [Fervidicoccus fontis]
MSGAKLSTKESSVLIIDFGGQYTHLISRRIRELGAFTIIVPYNRLNDIEINSFKSMILSGSHMSIENFSKESLEKAIDAIRSFNGTVLGICFGLQILSYYFGGKVNHDCGEYGETKVKILKNDPLFKGWNNEEKVWMSHEDCVSKPPQNSEVLSVSENGYIAALKLDLNGKVIYGVQFHPEVVHTPKGVILFENFLELSSVERNWRPEIYVNSIIEGLRKEVSDDGKALVAVSGGIDSTVSAIIAKKIFGNRLITAFVDHGLLREGEKEEVIEMLNFLELKPLVIDAEERFLNRLEGISDCEERRRIIGEEFAKIFEEIIEKEGIRYFVQGTTYPDVVESGKTQGSAAVIKSHHNVGGLPDWFKEKVKIIEPLKFLYKDEVRKIGTILGVPETLIKRHPFPGPGLAVRVIGKFSREKLEVAKKSSKIVEDVLKKYGLYEKVWQAFATVGEDKWVGVKGDSRSYGYIVTIRIVESTDGMTANYVRMPYEILDEIVKKITGSIKSVTMVTYAITSKPPSTIEPC